MCTLTVVSHAGRSRLVLSRDEQRSRSRALPPALRPVGGMVAAFPVDPDGGGTWIAAGERGPVLALINVNDRRPPPAGPLASRGSVIPALLGAGDLAETIERALTLDTRSMPPFRLALFAGDELAVLLGGRGEVRVLECGSVDRPRVFSSSGLGDEVVEHPRERLWTDMLAGAGDPFETQSAFHRHRWPDAGHLSVDMERVDARTVSRTEVEFIGAARVMTSFERDERGWGEPVRVRVPAHDGAAV
jgi:hypothetical protein